MDKKTFEALEKVVAMALAYEEGHEQWSTVNADAITQVNEWMQEVEKEIIS